MDVFQQASRLMSIMLLTKLLARNMPSKFIKHLFWSSRIEIDMLKVNSDLEEAIAQVIQEKWSVCGHKNNSET